MAYPFRRKLKFVKTFHDCLGFTGLSTAGTMLKNSHQLTKPVKTNRKSLLLTPGVDNEANSDSDKNTLFSTVTPSNSNTSMKSHAEKAPLSGDEIIHLKIVVDINLKIQNFSTEENTFEFESVEGNECHITLLHDDNTVSMTADKSCDRLSRVSFTADNSCDINQRDMSKSNMSFVAGLALSNKHSLPSEITSALARTKFEFPRHLKDYDEMITFYKYNLNNLAPEVDTLIQHVNHELDRSITSAQIREYRRYNISNKPRPLNVTCCKSCIFVCVSGKVYVCVSGKVHVNACKAQHTCNTVIPNGCFYELNGELDETMFAVQLKLQNNSFVSVDHF